jgi:RNA polymerase sigma-70 factor, ECF subfamily
MQLPHKGSFPEFMNICLTTTDPDAAVMLAFQCGDTDSFEFLVDRYRDQVLGYLYRFVHERAAAEELTQEVFLRVYQARGYQPSAKFRTWLFRIATNLALNWIRDRRVESGFLRLDEKPLYARAYDPVCGTPSVEDELVYRCRLDEVRAAVQALPERHRAAVLMHKYSEMEYWEIARALNCSVPALKSLLFRAYEVLRKRLAHLDCTTQSAA